MLTREENLLLKVIEKLDVIEKRLVDLENRIYDIQLQLNNATEHREEIKSHLHHACCR